MTLRCQSRSRSNKFCRTTEKVAAIDRKFCRCTASPFEQFVTQVPLHGLDLRADRGLADSQSFGRLAEIAQLGHRDKYFELAKCKSHTHPWRPVHGRGAVDCVLQH